MLLTRLPGGDFAEEFFDARHVFGHVDAHRIVPRFSDANLEAVFKPAKLLQLLELFKLPLREGGKFQESASAKYVEADVL